MHCRLRILLSLLFMLIACVEILAYPVGPAMSLDKMSDKADVILKVKATATTKTADPWFRDLQGYAVMATKLKVISTLKGNVKEAEVVFHHYGMDPDFKGGYMYSPQLYEFQAGRCYILFASVTDQPGVLRQMWQSHTMKNDLGVVRCVDDAPLKAEISVKAAILEDLTAQLSGDSSENVRYAIGQLEEMSDKSRTGLEDFDLDQVLKLIAPQALHKDPAIALAAIDVLGNQSPFRNAPSWLATVGKGTTLAKGQGKYPADWANAVAGRYRQLLVRAADQGTDAAARAAAIHALGLVREEELLTPLRRWSADRSPAVRAAAAVLWSDFPAGEAQVQLPVMASDKEAVVRAAAARAIGFAQADKLVGTLDRLLDDADETVQAAAAQSLLSFDVRIAGGVFKAHRADPRYRAVFINALADADPASWIDDLAEIIAKNQEPKIHCCSQMPVYTSWNLLMAYIEKQAAADVARGKFDRQLDALEQPPAIGSGPYQTLYRYYFEKKLSARGATFREKALKAVQGYDLDLYFKRIDGRDRG